MRAGQIPGAVIVVGHEGKVVYRRSFGYRILRPEKRAMEPLTVFDIASMTKVIATTTALLQLRDEGRLNLDDPVVKYWPEFRNHGKERVTVRQVLTHFSGLRPGIPLKGWSGYKAAMDKIQQEKLFSPPGGAFQYGDTNFAVAGELVRRISGRPLDEYCRERIFAPLGMKDTCFRPPPSFQERLAATRIGLHGVVHDPLAYKMGGVSGHAGVFSTADDLTVFAQMILDEGRGPDGRKILDPASVKELVSPQSPPGKMPLRGLGWDIHSPSGSEWGASLPPGSCAHRGFTGTLIWIDPASRSYLVVLTNRVYPDNESYPETLRGEVLQSVIESLSRAPKDRPRPDAPRTVRTGIDVLAAEDFLPLAGLRIGLITNHTGVDGAGRRTIDLLARAPGLSLKAIFSPEHGLGGEAEGKIASGRDAATDLPVYSLYGETRTPTPAMLQGLDALVFDIQDAGARFYTYPATMACALEAAARAGLSFFVLDRPNPITASVVQGPVMDSALKSFTGCFAMPIRHGMTIGELARMFNSENKTGARLTVIAMSGYKRTHWYDDTGLRWVKPSPNLRSLTQAILYPGAAVVEGANISVGRGTATPFELIGSPWIDGKEFGEYLNRRNIPGVRFESAEFIPERDAFQNQRCRGVRIILADRQALDTPALGVEIVSALYRLYPSRFQIEKTIGMVGARWVLQEIRAGQDPRSIAAKWQEDLDAFLRVRSNYLLY